MHSILLGTVLPWMFFIPWGFIKARKPMIWLAVGVLALVGIGTLIGLDLRSFFATGGSSSDAFNRSVYSLIMNTDFPLVAIVLGSIMNWLVCMCFWRSPKNAKPVPVKENVDSMQLEMANGKRV